MDLLDKPTDRRDALRCMAWAGTGALWAMSGGVASSTMLGGKGAGANAVPSFTFLQFSDSHVGFAKPANPDARATYREAISKVIAMPEKPDFIIHTGDITQLSRDQEFDDADQILKEAGIQTFHVPGEHDMLDEGNGKAFLARYGKGSKGAGWFSFDHKGVHFVGLVNVADLKPGGAGRLGAEQIAWLARDLAGHASSTPIVIFAHIPLWMLYAEWGWGTDDAAQALTHLRRFGSVTILNGHIHQIAQKVEGNMIFHTARSTAFPQPMPGTAPSPGPQVVPAGQLRGLLGITEATFKRGEHQIALVDNTLSA
ncbi:metallophosphoesterase [Sphingomonas sp. AR_OL41]|uniref:metallophosphoesterase family protein n=1 Tax=Sphingomonas sp. AR_OL41 TaxID=3042729 RepID=UPI00248170A8|nr:metallophosphoesterase [Sphingomonas sp. AR_OL41]MDH7971574.1 metallophosphoesterase [Sphingomonas sp. AR_OL41]